MEQGERRAVSMGLALLWTGPAFGVGIVLTGLPNPSASDAKECPKGMVPNLPMDLAIKRGSTHP